MNLQDVAAGVVSAVNRPTSVTLIPSTGYTTSADGSRTPTYGTPVTGWCQVQELTGDDLRQMDGLNLQGNHQGVYLDGVVAGAVRVSGEGGDLLQFGGQTWLVTKVLEQWQDSPWVKVVATLQDGN